MSNWDWSRYAVGGATRPDSFTGMRPEFSSSLQALFAAAPPELGLQVGSGYRSVERQRQLWEASDKSGRMVARPGGSRHNHGDAADLSAAGKRLDKASPEARQWVHDNAERYGLTFPMSWEPWHIELIGARGTKKAEASPLVSAVAEQAAPRGAAAAVAGLASGGQPGPAAPQTPPPSGESMAAPTVNIGIKPKRDTKLLDAMLANAMRQGSQAQNGWDLAGALAQTWAASSEKKEAEGEEAGELQKLVASQNLDPAFAAVAQLGGDRDSAAQAIMGQQQFRAQTAQRAEEQAWRQDERGYQRGRDGVADQRWESQQDYQRGQDTIANQRADRTLDLQTAKANQPPEPPSSVREYQFAQQQGFTGSFQEWEQANRKAGATNVSVGGTSTKFRDKADERMVERFGTIADTGTAAANVAQTIPAMRELLTQAPTGPVAGRLAERFPGFSSAGDAFQATVSQIAPTLRVPGSGAMSDRDMDILMSSFPRLRNGEGANDLIMGAFEKKAQLNLERSQVATAALRGEIDPAEADKRLQAIDSTPLLDDAMRARLGGGGDAVAPAAAPAGGPAPAAIGSQAEYDALPSGATFTAPDGTIRRKP
ncbi:MULTISPECIES: M15 family metallopeptidase [unclassified Aureimonas]|uniref:M15 family metallopeptidase n=1 Tax=unclassified Aureimonas TaxID=2615206 RepID=UPI0006F3E5A8|nr:MULTISPECIES: M15 family metallopeptidase [unclassified Aureimonas]KQT52271.1 hypothetical protein ASG62_16580 [Aureimonas sp. Leaf427]KQT73245.1 hypothetical protein ASG54_17855 [Aureimonas sp. Leaf460]